jgi:DNA polymerase-4
LSLDIFAEHTPVIEPLSLDEAYLDVIENLQDIPFARDIALQVRAKIKSETGLNASAGISYNKFLAKLAFRPPQAQRILWSLPSAPFPGTCSGCLFRSRTGPSRTR